MGTRVKASGRSTGRAPWLDGAVPVAGEGYGTSLLSRVYQAVSGVADRRVGWYRLPTPLGLAVLVGVRKTLRRHNLVDTGEIPSTDEHKVEPRDPRHLTTRSADGTYNDLSRPRMGMAGARFGRNVPHVRTFREPEPRMMQPNPRTVSRRLMTRERFQPATSINMLAAAWLQFMIRDWFSHGRGASEDAWQLDVEPGDDWPAPPLRIPRTPADPTRPPGSEQYPPTYLNRNTHWWDASSIYGNSREEQERLRTGEQGKLGVEPGGILPLPKDPAQDPAREPGFWLGLLMFHTIFTREHNAICDRLTAEYPHWDDEEVFQRARLVNAALIAKIHTVEWTPAVISHPTTVVALRANWWGLAGERVHRMFGRVSDSEVVSGIPGAATSHFGVPYSLTEEFVAVYRMHPLIRDEYSFRSASDGHPIRACTFRDIAGPAALDVAREIAAADLFYSFGTEHPGAIVCRNYPRFLQEYERPDGKLQDLAATDVLRSRELGVPRYNEFRRLMHLAPAKDFESLTDDPTLARDLREVYDGDVERVDLTVGMFAESRPQGFAFSDTAFRVFVLMASRRLNSDRFFTQDYTPEVYTRAGLDWVEQNTFGSVLLRHLPEVRPALRGVDNAFWPWRALHS